MSKKKKICELCDDNLVQNYTVLGICNACYAFLYYWKGATPKELLNHSKKIARWHHRMSKVLRKGIRTVRRAA